MTRFQSHECAGFRAEIRIEWTAPEGAEVPQGWQDRAEDLADTALLVSGPLVRGIVEAMRGRLNQ